MVQYSQSLSVKRSVEDSSDSARVVEFELAKIFENPPKGWTIEGKPRIVDCPYGKAVSFDGQQDALILDTNVLAGFNQFTIEIIMRPDTNGMKEQRFLHFGEVRGERVMIESRLVNDSWYLDTYMKSGQIGQTLVDSTRLHPLTKWYHIAFVANNGAMNAFVNGIKELEGKIPFTPFTVGQTSIGVRLNRVNWYKGAMFKLRISPTSLDPTRFLKIDQQ